MKTIPIALRNHYAQGTTTLATCWKATLTDGTVVAATAHDSDLVVDGVTYHATTGYNASDIDASADLNADNLEVTGFLASPAITDADIQSGKWDFAAVEIFEVNYRDLAAGKNILRVGTLGEVRAGRSTFTAELRGMLQAYTKTIVRITTRDCTAELGDARCRIDVTALTAVGMVETVTDNRILTDAARTEAADYFTGGKVTFTSGANSGLSMEVSRSAPGVLELYAPLYEAIQAGDTYTVTAGCAKRFYEDCVGKFNNGVNFRGFPHLPGNAIYRPGGATYAPAAPVYASGGGVYVPPADPGTGGGTGGAGAFPSGTNNKVGYYGHSFVTGYTGSGFVAVPQPERFAMLRPEFAVTNEGVNSNTTTKALAGTDGVHPAWSAEMASVDYGIVVIELGDGESWDISIAQYKTNLASLYAIAHDAGKQVVFQTAHKTIDDMASINAAMVEQAAALGAPCIDVYTWSLSAFTNPDIHFYCPDGRHPNQATYNMIAEYVAAQFPALTSAPSPGAYPAIRGPNPAEFKATPTFFDGFDGSALSNRWNTGIWYGSPSPAGTIRVANSCLEMCTRADMPLTGNHTDYVIVDTDPNNSHGATNPFSQKFGFFQCRAKLPVGKGYWPAFWLFNHTGVHRPEIDVFEAYPGGAYDWSSSDTAPHPMRADVTIHPLDDPGGYQATHVNFSLAKMDLSAAFHDYGVYWDADEMRFYFDGALVRTVTQADTMAWFAQFPLYIMFDFGLGSAAGDRSSDPAVSPYGFGSDPANPSANVFRIDYVAAWQFTKY